MNSHTPMIETDEKEISDRNSWDLYNWKKISGVFTNQTELFFNRIPSSHINDLESSRKKLVQLGASTGEFIAKFKSTRSVVAYDYSDVAISQLKKHGITSRLVNFNRTNADNKTLACKTFLEEDLSVPADILLIKILEYLNPETVKLLIFSLLDLAKPGSIFYLETLHSDKNETKFSPASPFYKVLEGNLLHLFFKPGYLASFVAPRTDMEVLFDQTECNNPMDKRRMKANSNYTVVNQLVFKKW